MKTAITATEPDPTGDKVPLVKGFDLASLKLPSFVDREVKVERVLTNVPISKPRADVFFRCHPDRSYWQTLLTIEIRADNDFFVVSPALYEALAAEPLAVPRILVPYVTRSGEPFLWPIRLPNSDGKVDEYNRSALEHAERAREVWMRILANKTIGCYERSEARDVLGEPKFPAKSAEELYEIALKNRLIMDIDHPLLRKLRGEL